MSFRQQLAAPWIGLWHFLKILFRWRLLLASLLSAVALCLVAASTQLVFGQLFQLCYVLDSITLMTMLCWMASGLALLIFGLPGLETLRGQPLPTPSRPHLLSSYMFWTGYLGTIGMCLVMYAHEKGLI